MGVVHPGPKNPNWRGGRTVKSDGYVLIRVGKGHHLADVRGYAYEHRVVAEQKLGRRLAPGEHVHHIDENKQNNAPENLEVLTGAAHRAEHRQEGSRLQQPGEPNPEVSCECGCGASFARYDGVGRPRRCLPGHNKRASPTVEAVLATLSDGPANRRDIAKGTGIGMRSLAVCLSKLKRAGLVENGAGGVWSRKAAA